MGFKHAKTFYNAFVKSNNETKTFVMKSKFDRPNVWREKQKATTNRLFRANVIDILMNLNQIEKSI